MQAFTAPLAIPRRPRPARTTRPHPPCCCAQQAPSKRPTAATAQPPLPASPTPPSPPPPPPPPPGLELLAHDMRTAAAFMRRLLHWEGGAWEGPRSSVGRRVVHMYAAAQGARERAVERGVGMVDGWGMLRAFRWQAIGAGERERWRAQVESFVDGRGGGAFGVVRGTVVAVIEAAFGGVEARVKGRMLGAGGRGETGVARAVWEMGVAGGRKALRAAGNVLVEKKAGSAVSGGELWKAVGVRRGRGRMGKVELWVTAAGLRHVKRREERKPAGHEKRDEAREVREELRDTDDVGSGDAAGVQGTKTDGTGPGFGKLAGVVAAGAAASVASSLLPGAVTVSAVAMTAVAMEQGKRRTEARGRAAGRAAGVRTKRRSLTGQRVSHALAGSQRRGTGLDVRRNEIGKAAKRADDAVIEATAYQVGQSVPAVAALPLVGATLAGLDAAAYAAETAAGRVGRAVRAEGGGGWRLLRSFRGVERYRA